MKKTASFCLRLTATAGVALIGLAGCANMHETSRQKPSAMAQAQPCAPAAAGDALVGNWMGVQKQKGVAGELHVLITLRADGAMAYGEQLKRGRRPPQGLNETGCWNRQGQSLVLRTTHSNGVAVEADDPIYTNQYAVRSASGARLVLAGPDGPLALRRMPDDYRMPMF